MPQNAFTIQIKSNKRKINISKKTSFLNNLELPFFVGVINQSKLRMTFYSGELLPIVFTNKGIPNQAYIKLCEELPSDAYENNEEIYFPLIGSIQANSSEDEIATFASNLSKACTEIQRHISTRNNMEPLYYISRLSLDLVLAGSSSTKVFRSNFLKRFAELFHNLRWLLRNSPSESSTLEIKKEARFWLNVYDQIPYDLTNTGLLENVANELRSMTED